MISMNSFWGSTLRLSKTEVRLCETLPKTDGYDFMRLDTFRNAATFVGSRSANEARGLEMRPVNETRAATSGQTGREEAATLRVR